MSGTTAGGKKAAETNRKKHGKDYYAKIAAKGGAISKTGGFYGDSTKARSAGIKGGYISKKGYKAIKKADGTYEYVKKEV